MSTIKSAIAVAWYSQSCLRVDSTKKALNTRYFLPLLRVQRERRFVEDDLNIAKLSVAHFEQSARRRILTENLLPSSRRSRRTSSRSADRITSRLCASSASVVGGPVPQRACLAYPPIAKRRDGSRHARGGELRCPTSLTHSFRERVLQSASTECG